MKKPQTISTEKIEAFARHSIGTLPDSMQARQDALLVLANLLPRDTTGRSVAREMLVHLERMNRVQAEFSFNTPA